MLFAATTETSPKKASIPFYLTIGMAASLNLIYIVDLIFKPRISIGAYWSLALLLSLILFAGVWFAEKKMASRATIGYLLINLVIFALDLISFYFFSSNYFPGLLRKLFSTTVADFLIRILSILK